MKDQRHCERLGTLGKTRDSGKDQGLWERLGTLGKTRIFVNTVDG